MTVENTNTTSSGESATPTSDQLVTSTPTTSKGETPAKSSTPSLEEAMTRLSEIERKHKNATEELDRHRKNAKKLADYEEAERKQQEAQLSEIERTTKKYQELQSQHDTYVKSMQERIVRYEVEKEAGKLGIIDPDAATKLLDWSQIEYEEDGTPKNADKLLAALVKQRPWLKPAQASPETEKTEQNAPAAAQQQQATPTTPPRIPAMSPGRSTIAAPSAVPPGKIPRLGDRGVFSAPGTIRQQ